MKLKIYTKRKKKNIEEHKHVETEQHSAKSVSQPWNQRGNQKISETIENGNAAPPNLQNVAKAVLSRPIATWGAQSTEKISRNLAFQLKVLEKGK